MITLTTYRTVNPSQNQFIIEFVYTEEQYQEIENVKDVSFETFWSGIGGFVGIFLGYSMMQFPELIEYLSVLFHNVKDILRS